METGVTAPTSAARRAAVFQRIRDAHQTEMAEDYVELIEDLIAETGEARLVDLAEHMGVTHATAAKVVQRLQREGFVLTRPYRSIFLTDQGHEMASMARRRHQIVLAFLRAIGVAEAVAEIDSEGIEHHVSEETLAAFERITEKLNAGGN
jgi:DtxR family manganese transport transcriptional regulator